MGSDIDRDEERARLQEVSDLLEEEKAALCEREAIKMKREDEAREQKAREEEGARLQAVSDEEQAAAREMEAWYLEHMAEIKVNTEKQEGVQAWREKLNILLARKRSARQPGPPPSRKPRPPPGSPPRPGKRAREGDARNHGDQ